MLVFLVSKEKTIKKPQCVALLILFIYVISFAYFNLLTVQQLADKISENLPINFHK